jgi:hypothetical protein
MVGFLEWYLSDDLMETAANHFFLSTQQMAYEHVVNLDYSKNKLGRFKGF